MTVSLSKISWSFLGAGLFLPCLVQCLFYFKILPIERMPDWLFIAIWPAFGFYMASDTGNGPDIVRATFGFLMSVVANGLIYLALGALVSFFCRRFIFGKA
jgi:hypothetical protein